MKEAAITELKKYQSVYKDYVEYWLEIFKVHETERKMLPELFEKWKDGQLEWLDPEAEVDFAKVLIDCQYYKEAIQIVEKKEALGQVSPDMLRLKARLLMEDNQAVTALDILLNIRYFSVIQRFFWNTGNSIKNGVRCFGDIVYR